MNNFSLFFPSSGPPSFILHDLNPLSKFWGPLQKDFEEFVFKYDKKLNDLIHEFNGFIWCHCHGKIGLFLKRFIEMGVDCLNPVEPPPMGDVTLAEAKKQVGNKICLEGNIEQDNFYTATEEEMLKLVKNAIRQGGPGGNFILCPTASFQQKPVCDKKTLKNYLIFIRAGKMFGKYPLEL